MPVPRHPPLPCRASPPQGGRLAALASGPTIDKWRDRQGRPISPLEGEIAGRPEGGASHNARLSVASALAATLVAAIPLPASAEPLPAGFVRLADIAPSIRQDIRHAG